MSSTRSITENAHDTGAPRVIRMDERDNVAIVANAGGLETGATFVSGFAAGLKLRDRVPQGHKVALVDIGEGEAVVRYGIAIGYAQKAIPAGSWVHERLLRMPAGAGAAVPDTVTGSTTAAGGGAVPVAATC